MDIRFSILIFLNDGQMGISGSSFLQNAAMDPSSRKGQGSRASFWLWLTLLSSSFDNGSLSPHKSFKYHQRFKETRSERLLIWWNRPLVKGSVDLNAGPDPKPSFLLTQNLSLATLCNIKYCFKRPNSAEQIVHHHC